MRINFTSEQTKFVQELEHNKRLTQQIVELLLEKILDIDRRIETLSKKLILLNEQKAHIQRQMEQLKLDAASRYKEGLQVVLGALNVATPYDARLIQSETGEPVAVEVEINKP